MQPTLRLEELNKESLPVAGGKGANLGEMVQAGLPVPPGFVVTAGAYQTFMAAAGLPDRIGQRLQGLVADDLAPIEAATADIQAWIESAPIPAELAEPITRSYIELSNRLPAGPEGLAVAVRSSATAEDLPDASFAGQQETYLNIRGTEAVLAAVRSCWASLWGPRAVAYRIKMGYDHLSVSLAAVVQAMVPSAVAGVMFTANPMTGARDEFVVTGSYGLGESVVSGLVTPDTFTLTADGAVRQRILGTKAQQIIPTPEGTRQEDVAEADRSRYCLTDAELAQLAALGRKVSAHYGAPQDIEWGLVGGNLYLLQTRPITTLKAAAAAPATERPLSKRERFILQRMASSFADHFPDPMAPLDFTTVVQEALRSIMAMAGEFGVRANMEKTSEELPDGRFALRPPIPGPSVAMLWKAPGRLLRALREDPAAAWAQLKDEALRALAPLEAGDLAALSTSELASRIAKLTALFEHWEPRRFQRIFPAALLREAIVKRLTRKAVGPDETDKVVRQLFLAVPYRTSTMNRAVARLAQVAAEHGKESPTFRAALEIFLGEWGDRPARGMVPVPSFPTWREDPSVVLGLVDALLNDPASRDADAIERKHEAEFAAARDRVAAKLGPTARRWFVDSLGIARRGLVSREDSLFLTERFSAVVRRLALALGGRLTQTGALAEPTQVFFLTASEMIPAAQGQLEIKERIARRKNGLAAVEAAVRRGDTWLVASGSLPASFSAKSSSAPADALLTGIAASAGRVTGPVRVVLGPADFGRLQKGDILVCPATAPSWTPLFSLAAAVVTDTGGPLSHSAIVAREYGIPAVLGAGRATTLLTDGQAITVDGNTGWVGGAM